MAPQYPIKKIVEEKPFHQKDAVKSAITGAMVGGGAGFLLSAAQNSLAKQNVGPWGVFTRTGGTITSLGMNTVSFPFVDIASWDRLTFGYSSLSCSHNGLQLLERCRRQPAPEG